MPTIYKVLGQEAPAADVDTTLYTSPASTQTVISTITVCNFGEADAPPAEFRIAVRPAGAVLANKHYVYHHAALAEGATVAITIGITLAATDVVTIRTDTATLAFNAYGTQVS